MGVSLAYESNVSKSWHICYSNGVLEQEIFDSIRSQIYGVTIETKSGDSVTEHRADNKTEQLTLGRGKVGIRIRKQIVVEIVPLGPADQAGVKVGDKILAANGIALNSEEGLHDVALITGDPGTTATLTILRGGQVFEISVVRE